MESVKCHPTQRADLGQNARFHLVKRVQIHRIVIWLVDPHLLPEVWQCHVPGLLLLSTCLSKNILQDLVGSFHLLVMWYGTWLASSLPFSLVYGVYVQVENGLRDELLVTERTTEFQLVRSGMNLAMVQKYVRLLPPFHVSSGATRHSADVHLGHPLDITWDFSGRKMYSITSFLYILAS